MIDRRQVPAAPGAVRESFRGLPPAAHGNTYGRRGERHFGESTFHEILCSVVAPSQERRRPACANFEAMVRAVVLKAIEGGATAFREVMEWTREFGIGMDRQFETR